MSRTLIPMLQEADIKHLQAMALMIALGMFRTHLSDIEHGRNIDRNPEDWIAEGVDRSGLVGWLTDANNIMEKWSTGQIGVSRLVGKSPNSRYLNRDRWGALLGPSAGMLEDVSNMVSNAVSEDGIDKPDIDRLRRLMPYQNLIWMRGLFDEIEETLKDGI